jgi:hypothetical protein
LKGSENFTPAYDRQELIYDSIFRYLSEANAMIVPGNITNDISMGAILINGKD